MLCIVKGSGIRRDIWNIQEYFLSETTAPLRTSSKTNWILQNIYMEKWSTEETEAKSEFLWYWFHTGEISLAGSKTTLWNLLYDKKLVRKWKWSCLNKHNFHAATLFCNMQPEIFDETAHFIIYMFFSMTTEKKKSLHCKDYKEKNRKTTVFCRNFTSYNFLSKLRKRMGSFQKRHLYLQELQSNLYIYLWVLWTVITFLVFIFLEHQIIFKHYCNLLFTSRFLLFMAYYGS